MALMTESLERRFDAAFGATRTEQERNERLQEQILRLETDLSRWGKHLLWMIKSNQKETTLSACFYSKALILGRFLINQRIKLMPLSKFYLWFHLPIVNENFTVKQ
jgi:hypothetical protein